MTRPARTLWLLVLMLAVAALPPAAAAAQPAERRAGPADPQELAAWLDSRIADSLARYQIPGAAITVVQDGALAVARGYGYAEVAGRVPFDPEQTVIRAKSITKLFTATAVMQLAEQNRLDLDADVNGYLSDFQVPAAFGAPITARHLLTHTAGFEDHGLATVARTAANLAPLGTYLAARLPARIFPPGAVVSYTDHGTSLAGHLVELAAGVPFARYLDEAILRPLGMDDSSCAQPQPPELAARLATGYALRGGAPRPRTTGYFLVAPAVCLVTTAADMAPFMIAHLQDGRFGAARILAPETAQEMHRQQFTHHPALPGWAIGFQEQYRNGRRALVHYGGGDGFSNFLFLLPDQDFGFFLTANRGDAFALHAELTQALMDRYFPAAAEPAAPQPLDGYRERAPRLAGTYRFYRYDRSTVEKISFDDEVSVRAERDGTVQTSATAGRYVQVAPLLLQRTDGEGHIAFRADAAGRITHLLVGSYAYERLAWYETVGWHAMLMGLILGAFAAMVVSALVRRQRRTPAAAPLEQLALRWAVVTSALNLAWVITLAAVILATGVLAGGGTVFDYGMPAAVQALLAVPLAGVGLAAGQAIGCILVWRHRWGSVAGRVQHTLVALGAWALTWSLHYWNLLGFRY